MESKRSLSAANISESELKSRKIRKLRNLNLPDIGEVKWIVTQNTWQASEQK
jgi:hypothetical protein